MHTTLRDYSVYVYERAVYDCFIILYLCVSVHLSNCLPVCTSIHLLDCASVYLFDCLSISLSDCMSVQLSVCLCKGRQYLCSGVAMLTPVVETLTVQLVLSHGASLRAPCGHHA